MGEILVEKVAKKAVKVCEGCPVSIGGMVGIHVGHELIARADGLYTRSDYTDPVPTFAVLVIGAQVSVVVPEHFPSDEMPEFAIALHEHENPVCAQEVRTPAVALHKLGRELLAEYVSAGRLVRDFRGVWHWDGQKPSKQSEPSQS